MVKQLKNRYGDVSSNRKFCLGVDRGKMKLYDLDDPTEGLVDEKALMDNTEFGKRDFDATKFEGFY